MLGCLRDDGIRERFQRDPSMIPAKTTKGKKKEKKKKLQKGLSSSKSTNSGEVMKQKASPMSK